MGLRTTGIALLSLTCLTGSAGAIELRLPAECTLGTDCFLQQSPDMKAGPGTTDPFCGIATYEGHDGVDLRVLSMKDVARGVPVVAAADGEVLRGRDGVADHLVQTDVDRQAVADKECGNGVIMKHQDGTETQYCHLKQGSIVVRPGQKLKAGDKIGEVGASGLAQFPHVHMTVRVGKDEMDPLTGRKIGDGCVADPADAHPLFSTAVMDGLPRDKPDILGFGLTGSVVDYDKLAVDGPPADASSSSQATVVWGWIANLKAGDRLRFTMADPNGQPLVDTTTDPLDRNKAVYSAYSGKRGSPMQGSYAIGLEVIRDGKAIVDRKTTVSVK
ncbi:MAG: hypothetical protein JWL86_5866 [Rhizobium sp.]|nr:hypothetical protein [Rhizobium sp.]